MEKSLSFREVEVIMQSAVLSGVKVLDLTTFLAAPQCGRALAALGADVIKVEAPEKDFFRIESPLFEVGIPCTDDENPIFLNTNAGKRFITMNLKDPRCKEVVRKLIEQSDILITNMRTAALEKLGIGYEQAHEWNPRLVYGHLDGYGQKGAEAPKPGFDSQAYLARGGYLLDLTEEGCTPNEQVLGMGDSATGIALLSGVLASFVRAQTTGQGSFVNISLLNTAMWNGLMHHTLLQYGIEPQTTRKKPIGFAVANNYQCKDGTWINLNTSQGLMKTWKDLCEAVGVPELVDDERFNTPEKQRENRAEATAILDGIFAQKNFEEWDAILSKVDIAYERTAHLLDVTRDPQALENNYFIQRDYPSGKSIKVAAVPFQMEGIHEDLTKPIHFGGHTREILQELGYAEEIIDQMYQDKAIM